MSIIQNQVANQAYTNLSGALGSGATTFNVTGGQGALFPSTYPYRLVLVQYTTVNLPSSGVVKYEIVTVTNRTTDTFTVTRGAESTSATGFNTNDNVYLTYTKGMYDEVLNAILRQESIYTTTGSANAYVVSSVPGVSALADITKLTLKANFTGTGACTLNVNSLGAVAIKKKNSIALVSNDIENGEIFTVNYDGTNFVIEETNNNAIITSSGSANAYILTPSVALGAYYAGHTIEFQANFACTGASTVNISGLGAKNIYKNGGTTALASDDIGINSINRIVYDGTQYQMATPSSSAPMSRASAITLFSPAGDAFLGNLTASGTVTLTGNNYAINEHYYGNFTLGANTLTCSTVGATHIVYVSGNLSLASGTVAFSGKGGAASAVANNAVAPSVWTTTGIMTGGVSNSGLPAVGTGGSFTANTNSIQYILGKWITGARIGPGSGGGAGVAGGNTAAGGAGGGCIIFIVSGNVTLTSSTATVAGSAGTTTLVNGGGGGGGYFGLFYKGTLTGSLTPTVSGGLGGTAGGAGSYQGGSGSGSSANGEAGVNNTRGGNGGVGKYDILNISF